MGRTGIYACGESVSRRNSLESVALFSLKQEAPASIGGSTFTVAAHTGDNNNGYIEYDTETKELGVHLNDDVMNERARQYLTTEKVLHQYTDLAQYKTISTVPTSSLEMLKLALCYIWRATGIHIDWSRPVD